MYSQTTRAITVTVQPIYLDDQSAPDESHGRIQEVRGAGVVGEQPVLKPGESFEYTSGTPLPTPSGFMVGTYQMENETGERFDVAVPAFSLDTPHQPKRVN